MRGPGQTSGDAEIVERGGAEPRRRLAEFEWQIQMRHLSQARIHCGARDIGACALGRQVQQGFGVRLEGVEERQLLLLPMESNAGLDPGVEVVIREEKQTGSERPECLGLEFRDGTRKSISVRAKGEWIRTSSRSTPGMSRP